MSASGTMPAETFTTALEGIWGPVETWAEGLLPSAISLLTGVALSFTGQQIVVAGKMASAFKKSIAAGSTQAVAWQAAWKELTTDELTIIEGVEMSGLNFIITASASAP